MNLDSLRFLCNDKIIVDIKNNRHGYDLIIWYDITSMIKDVPSYIESVLVHVFDIFSEEDGFEEEDDLPSIIRDIIKTIESREDLYHLGNIDYDDAVKICFKDGMCLSEYNYEEGGRIFFFKRH